MRIEIWGVLDGPGNDGNANCSWAKRHFYESGLKGEKWGRSAFLSLQSNVMEVLFPHFSNSSSHKA